MRHRQVLRRFHIRRELLEVEGAFGSESEEMDYSNGMREDKREINGEGVVRPELERWEKKPRAGGIDVGCEVVE